MRWLRADLLEAALAVAELDAEEEADGAFDLALARLELAADRWSRRDFDLEEDNRP